MCMWAYFLGPYLSHITDMGQTAALQLILAALKHFCHLEIHTKIIKNCPFFLSLSIKNGHRRKNCPKKFIAPQKFHCWGPQWNKNFKLGPRVKKVWPSLAYNKGNLYCHVYLRIDSPFSFELCESVESSELFSELPESSLLSLSSLLRVGVMVCIDVIIGSIPDSNSRASTTGVSSSSSIFVSILKPSQLFLTDQ